MYVYTYVCTYVYTYIHSYTSHPQSTVASLSHLRKRVTQKSHARAAKHMRTSLQAQNKKKKISPTLTRKRHSRAVEHARVFAAQHAAGLVRLQYRGLV
jgi:hypothetical protein